MNDEINLILTKLKLVSESEESCAYICDKEHSKILYDYITNLQETLKKKQQRIKELLEETYSANQVVEELLDIEEENKRLKELCDKYEEEHSTRFNDWVFDKRENERLKAREEEISKMYLAGHKYASEMEGKYILAKYVIDELEKWLEENDKQLCLRKLRELKEGK